MEHTQSSNVPKRLIELGDLAEACRDAFLQASSSSHWKPAPKSAASAFQVALTQHDPATSTAELLSGFDLTTEVIVTYLEVAAGHLGGLAALYRSGEAMFPPLPLARSVMEYSAHAMWVVGDNTGTPAAMLARAYLEEFTSCEFQKLAAKKMGSDTEEAYKQATERWSTVRQRAIDAFPGTTRDHMSESKPGRSILDQVLPRPEEAVTWMFNLLHKGVSGTITEDHAVGVYAFLSSGTHPSLYQARQLRIPIDHRGHSGTILKMDIVFLERLIAATVLVYYNALGYVMSFYGLDRSPHDALTAKIDRVLPGCLT